MALGLIGGTVGAALGLVNGAQGLAPTLTNDLSQIFNVLNPNQRADLATLIIMRRRLEITETEYYDGMRKNGFAQDLADKIFTSAYAFFGLQDYCTMFRRGDINETQFNTLLGQIGINSWHAEQSLRLTEYWPTPADIVQFAVREVYDKTKRDALKLDSERPDFYLDMAKKVGLSEDFAKDYWASHWELPSVSAVMEFMHRRVKTPEDKVFTQDDAYKFLEYADYSPQWRQMLIDISYQPLTRVDTRRMYGLGVLTYEELVGNFLDQGYSPENAARMAEFTAIHDNPETTDMTRTNLTSSYVHGIITLDELVELLGSLGYQVKMLNYWVNIAQYDKVQYQVNLKSGHLLDLYLQGGNSLDEYRNELYRMDLPSNYVNQLIDEALSKRMSTQKIPDLSTLKDWLAEGIIDDIGFYNRMRLLNYRDEDIRNYLAEIALKQDVTTRKYLKDTVYKSWLKKGIMSRDQFTLIMHEQGYSKQDIENMIIEVESGKNISQTSTN
jgi:hypothetical protein